MLWVHCIALTLFMRIIKGIQSVKQLQLSMWVWFLGRPSLNCSKWKRMPVKENTCEFCGLHNIHTFVKTLNVFNIIALLFMNIVCVPLHMLFVISVTTSCCSDSANVVSVKCEQLSVCCWSSAVKSKLILNHRLSCFKKGRPHTLCQILTDF